MAEDHHRQTGTTTEDEAVVTAARRVRDDLIRQPFALAVLVVFAGSLLFLMGIQVGEILYRAFDGEGAMAALFGATLVATLVAIVAIGVWLDRRQRARGASSSPLTDDQRAQLEAFVRPTSALVRWYRPATIAVFITLAVPGVRLLDTPWDSIWIIAVLVANPLGRWLRAHGHILTTRDLDVPVPGLSPWPAIAVAALAATTGIAVAILLWTETLHSTLATTITGIIVVSVIVGGGLATDVHQRRHITRSLATP